MLNIAICDDDTDFSNELESLILNVAEKERMEIDTEVYIDGAELVRDYCSKVRYDFIFLDIEMERMDGKETATKIRGFDKEVLILFISNYEKYCKDLFILEPVRYIPKPLEIEEFRWHFLKACERVRYLGKTFQYFYNKKNHEIPLNKIFYFESVNRQIFIYYMGVDISGKEEKEIDMQQYFYTSNKKLDDIEKELKQSSSRFLRINRSYLVNYDHICEVTLEKIILKNAAGTKLNFEIAKNRQDKVRNQLVGLYSEYRK